MTDAASWHTSEFPELRAGPPWVMEEMILSQPGLVGPILGAADSGAALQIRTAAEHAALAGEPIVITGCGTSQHGAFAVAELVSGYLRDAAFPARAEARESYDAALEPRSGGLCLGVSHSGETGATALALRAAGAGGAATAVITAEAGSAIAGAAEHALVTPAIDRSWCHTVAFTSAILAGGAITDRGGELADCERAIDSALAARPRLADAAGVLAGSSRIAAVGLGIDLIAARELALKIEEGSRVAATAWHLESFLHGHLAGCDGSTGLVLLAVDPRHAARRDRRLAAAAAAAAAIGLPVVLIAGPGCEAEVPAGSIRVDLELSDPGSLLQSLLASAVAVQLLTLEIVMAVGVNPDLIRREQEPYRNAAAIVDASTGW